ncbi:MAG: hypothetical protein K6B14_00030 [Lachnospiraceae bacterium]|nr:hypothetical protein [Lachnospiraceae bacterium]
MDDHILTSRDKNDIFWVKKRRYMVSSDLKSMSQRGHFNPDMIAEVKSAYERYPEGLSFYELTGNEFMDPPPTASGQIAFAKSVATMMHTLDSIDSADVSADSLGHKFDDIIRFAKVLIRQTIDSYFNGCGVDKDGNETGNRSKADTAQSMFYRNRKKYENLIKVERKNAGYELIDAIRQEHGIDELIETDETGEDPALEQLIAQNAEAAEKCREKIDALRAISRRDIIEASQRRAARDALLEPVTKRLEDDSLNEWENRILKGAFNSYMSEVERNLRWLLYRREAVYYLARWFLLGEPVDDIIADKITVISHENPDELDGSKKLADIAGYIKPEEDEYKGLPKDDIGAIFELGEELRQYVTDHPYHFESQCLLSITHDLDDLSKVLPKAWEMIKAVDRITISGEFNSLSEEDRQRMFDLWVVSDVISIIGYTITEVIVGDPDKTIKEATETLEGLLPMLSYYNTEKDVRKMLSEIVMERSDFYVY